MHVVCGYPRLKTKGDQGDHGKSKVKEELGTDSTNPAPASVTKKVKAKAAKGVKKK